MSTFLTVANCMVRRLRRLIEEFITEDSGHPTPVQHAYSSAQVLYTDFANVLCPSERDVHKGVVVPHDEGLETRNP